MIIENISKFKYRDKISKETKKIKENTGNNTVKAKIIEEYKYYICDYCGKEIRLDKKQEEREGGLCHLPTSLTRTAYQVSLALHNKCLKSVIKEFEN